MSFAAARGMTVFRLRRDQLRLLSVRLHSPLDCLLFIDTEADHPITRWPDHPIRSRPDHPIPSCPDHPLRNRPPRSIPLASLANSKTSSPLLRAPACLKTVSRSSTSARLSIPFRESGGNACCTCGRRSETRCGGLSISNARTDSFVSPCSASAKASRSGWRSSPNGMGDRRQRSAKRGCNINGCSGACWNEISQIGTSTSLLQPPISNAASAQCTRADCCGADVRRYACLVSMTPSCRLQSMAR